MIHMHNLTYMLKHSCMQWLKSCFLNYILEWEKEANAKTEFTASKHKKMQLSKETRDGLKMTSTLYYFASESIYASLHILIITVALAFCELGPKMLSIPGVRFLLTERFNQDSLESYFGKQQARGSYCDNPTVDQFFDNNNALRIINQLHLDLPGSNIRGRQRQQYADMDTPLPKQPRRATSQMRSNI